MEGELIRFRVDAAIRDQAAAVCEKLGFDLADVLRAFVARIAEQGTVPFDMGVAPQARGPRAPFADYTERLWREYRYVDAEVALALLARFMANHAAALDAEQRQPQPNAARLRELSEEIARARALAQGLDPDDAEAVAAVLARYGPRVASFE